MVANTYWDEKTKRSFQTLHIFLQKFGTVIYCTASMYFRGNRDENIREKFKVLVYKPTCRKLEEKLHFQTLVFCPDDAFACKPVSHGHKCWGNWLELVFMVWASSCSPLLGHTRSRDRYWAASRLSHRPEPSGHALNVRSIDLTLEDNMADDLFFCATLTGRWGGHSPVVQAGAETSDTGAETVKPDPAPLGMVIPGGWVPMSGMKVLSLAVLSAHSTFHRWSAHCAALLFLLSDELMCCCAAGTTGCLDLRSRAFAPLRRYAEGWMPARIGRLSGRAIDLLAQRHMNNRSVRNHKRKVH